MILVCLLACDKGREDEHSEHCRHREVKIYSPKRKLRTRALGGIDVAHPPTVTHTYTHGETSFVRLNNFLGFVHTWPRTCEWEVSAKIGQTLSRPHPIGKHKMQAGRQKKKPVKKVCEGTYFVHPRIG